MTRGEIAVIGLGAQRARGRRAARARRARACTRRDAGHRRRRARDAPRALAPLGVDVRASAATTSSASRAARSSSRAPACRPTRRRSSRRATPACRSSSEIEVALQYLPGLRYIADHRHQRQDDDDGAHRPPAARARLRRASTRATSARRWPRSRCASGSPDWVALEMSSFQLHDTPSIDAGGRRAHEPERRTTSTGTTSVDEYYADKALLFRERDAALALGARTPTIAARAGDGRDGVAGHASALLDRAGRGATRTSTARADALVVLGEPLIARDELHAARRSQRRQRARRRARRDGRRRGARDARRARARIADGAARRSARSRIASSPSASTTACSGSTTPRRRTSARRSSRCAA